jgi:glutathione S-transferase
VWRAPPGLVQGLDGEFCLDTSKLDTVVESPIRLYGIVRQAGASDERVKRDLAEPPGLLDRVDSLLEDGVIGGEELGAADFQIGSSVRVLIAMQDVYRLVAGRPAESFARSVRYVLDRLLIIQREDRAL